MATSFGFHLIIFFSFFLTTLMVSASATVATSDNNWMRMNPAACTGSIAECMMSEEFGMNSESNRRILATTNYISYEALQRNNVPCSQRGASYYNCEQGAEANPYNRGCSAITRCRS